MAVMVALKHILRDTNGSLRYKRRVPKSIQPLFGGKQYFIKVLGRTEAEALVSYGPYHKHIETLIRLAKARGGELTPMQLAEKNRALLTEWGANPGGPGADGNEGLWRDAAAERLLEKYPRDVQTGEYIGISVEDASLAEALFSGVTRQEEEPTLTDAFAFYLKEKGKANPTERSRQENRLHFVQRIALETLRSDMKLSDIKRPEARAIRDALLATGMKPASVQRRLKDLSAVFRFAAIEHSVEAVSPFSSLPMPAETSEGRRGRPPLPEQLIAAMYERLNARARADILEAWTLLHHTGARLGEIAGLAMADIVLDTETPHIVIEPKPWRRIKNRWSERKVPLIGEALSVAHKIKDQRGRYDYVFPRYIKGRGADRMSYDLMKHLKQVRENDKQVLHSLRHTMKDALRNAGVSHELACAILGHELSKGIDKEYGTGFYLRLMEDALLKVFPLV